MEDVNYIHRYVEPAVRSSALTVLLLHGTGGDENDLLNLGRTVAPGARLISPRGKVLENGMARFFRRIREGVFDEEDVRRRAAELSLFITQSAEHYHFPADRVVALGYSNGANIAAALVFLSPGALAGAVLLRAQPPLSVPVLPDLAGKPVYIGAGRSDGIVPPAQAEHLIEQLTEAGADVHAVWQNSGHGLSQREIEPISDWITDPRRAWNTH